MCSSSPVRTGRASSVEAAICVCSTARSRPSSGIVSRSPSSGRGPGGNSSASMHLMCVSKRPQRTARVWVAVSRLISSVSSGRLPTKSVSSRAGTVVLPSSATAAGTTFRMPISRFVAVRARPSAVVSRRTLFRMGSVVRVEMARDTVCNAWPRVLGWQVSLKAGSLSPVILYSFLIRSP